MKRLSNLPPGVTDRMIDEHAGVWQGEEDEAKRQHARPSVPGTIMVNHMTFFPTAQAAVKIAIANGGEVDGYIVKPAVGRPGKWVIEVFDPEDGFHLGYL